MNEKIKQPTQTRPVGSDMTMDEILSSIRKIISTEDHLKSDSQDEPEMKMMNKKVKTPDIKVPLSSQEQLKSLSTPGFEDMNIMPENWKSTMDMPPKAMPKQAPQQKKAPTPHNMKMAEPQPMPSSSMQNAETSEILKTLEEIKKSLSTENLQKASHEMSHNDMMMPEETSPSMPNTPMEMEETILQDIKINQDEQHTNIDFKPVHFEQDDIPDFLKKFKKEQEDTQNIIPPEDRETYNFKAMQSFEDNDDAIMELTEALKEKETMDKIVESSTSQLVQKKSETSNLKTMPSSDDDGISDALEMLMIKSLRPMLKEWVEDNIADIAQKVLREELQKRGQKHKS